MYEGLPLSATIFLAFWANKFNNLNSILKNLESCEIMGQATNICTDTSGTLTTNSISVETLFICGK